MSTEKEDLKRYLQSQREALLWKLDGLSEHDARWPSTPTGSNLLGMVKHVASVEARYFGEVFGRPFPEAFPWFAEGAEDNADFWATLDESIASITGLYRRVWAHSDATIDALALDAPGRVGWWAPSRQHVTLHRILVHMIAETARHAGHADIIREQLDGEVGFGRGNDNLPDHDGIWWEVYRARLERLADAAGTGRPDSYSTD